MLLGTTKFTAGVSFVSEMCVVYTKLSDAAAAAIDWCRGKHKLLMEANLSQTLFP